MDQNVSIREAKRSDCPALRAMIQELANFQKLPSGPKIDCEDLERAGFDTQPPLFMSYVAIIADKAVGYALFCDAFSSWIGKYIYLDSLYVSMDYRNLKLGSKLFNKVIQFAKDNNYARVDFDVLNWNPAKEFYERKGAKNVTKLEGWELHRMEIEAMLKICLEK